MRQLIITGNLTNDVELIYSEDGKPRAKFKVANNDRPDNVLFMPIVVFGTQAENCANYLSKGSKVLVCGDLSVRDYENKDGLTKTWVEVLANRVEFLSPKKSEEETPDVE